MNKQEFILEAENFKKNLIHSSKKFFLQKFKTLEVEDFKTLEEFTNKSIIDGVGLPASMNNPGEQMAYLAGRKSVLEDLKRYAFLYRE